MPSFSEISSNRLATCDERLQKLFNTVIEYFDCTILDGHRTKDKQREAFEKGFSKVDWPNSKHNRFPSMAVDVAPYPIDWKDRERFIYFAGKVMAVAAILDFKVRWGGDWNRNDKMTDEDFRDLVHFELVDQ